MNVTTLPAQLADELAKLPPRDYSAALLAINGRDGCRGLRAKYIRALYDAACMQKLPDQIVHDVAEQIQRCVTAPCGHGSL